VSRSTWGGNVPTPGDAITGEGAGAPTPCGPLSGTQSTPRGRRVGLVAIIAVALATAVAVAAAGARADPGGPAPAVALVPSEPADTAGAPSTSAAASADPSAATSGAAEPATSTEPAKPIDVPLRGPGTFRRTSLDLAPPNGGGRVIRFDVRVERGLRIDVDAVAREIHRTLSDPRSWRGTDRVRFQLVSDPGRARLHAYIATPRTTDRLCYPWLTRGAVSCQTGNRVVLNARRWVFGAKPYAADVAGYRKYLVNHEFGHALGYGHVRCPGKGRRAPVMMQQTKGLQGCRPNPWPTVAR
jgi:hypothetical protein